MFRAISDLNSGITTSMIAMRAPLRSLARQLDLRLQPGTELHQFCKTANRIGIFL
jgi:hypothetical protein